VTFIVGYLIAAVAFTSGGAPTDVVLVPDVRELDVEEASRLMSSTSLELTIGDSLANATIPAGAVLAQSPLPGQEVSRGTEVRVIVSTGQHRPRVPEVEAMPVALAMRALEAAGFEVEIEEAPGEGQLGRVVSVAPEAGTLVPLPATVRIRVGSIESVREMPSVLGLDEEEAREFLEGIGLNVTEVMYESSESVEPYHVIQQIPPPGDEIEPGDAVRLRVALPAVIQSRDGAPIRAPLATRSF
jgi:eukaryotic-like serine/threonine-protein kinase